MHSQDLSWGTFCGRRRSTAPVTSRSTGTRSKVGLPWTVHPPSAVAALEGGTIIDAAGARFEVLAARRRDIPGASTCHTDFARIFERLEECAAQDVMAAPDIIFREPAVVQNGDPVVQQCSQWPSEMQHLATVSLHLLQVNTRDRWSARRRRPELATGCGADAIVAASGARPKRVARPCCPPSRFRLCFSL